MRLYNVLVPAGVWTVKQFYLFHGAMVVKVNTCWHAGLLKPDVYGPRDCPAACCGTLCPSLESDHGGHLFLTRPNPDYHWRCGSCSSDSGNSLYGPKNGVACSLFHLAAAWGLGCGRTRSVRISLPIRHWFYLWC
jgi:hypothetical protein